MVAESASAKGLHSLIRGDCREGKKKKKKKKEKKKTNNTLVCEAASGNSPHSFLPLEMQSMCTSR